MLDSLRRNLRRETGRFLARESQVLILLSFVIGILVGLVIVAFILLTGNLTHRMYPPGSPLLLRVLTPAIGALISGWLLYRFFPDARGSGIPQTKFALFIHDGYIGLKTVVGKFVCCSISLGSGIALGREGPSVQIGAGIASVLGRRFRLSTETVKALLPVGCSAALAAAFNTPIAAVLFSLEEVLGDLHAPVLGSVVIASTTSWMVLHLILGDDPLFHVPAYQLVNPFAEFAIYPILGIVVGLGSVAFVKLLLNMRVWFRRLPRNTIWLQPVAGGLLVGLLALYNPNVLGVGYDFVERVLTGDMALKTIAILAVLKIVATATCYSSGNAGGIFGPALFIGAMLGGVVGSIAHSLFPAYTANPGAYALVGMGAAFAGIIRTPLTSVIMIFELTRDYSIIVPLMIANMISFFISQHLQHEPIYEAIATQDGIVLPAGEAREHFAKRNVGSFMRENPLGLSEEPASYVHTDHSLSIALERMGEAGLEIIPVVSRADLRKQLGTITLTEVLRAYGVSRSGTISDQPA